MIRTWALLLLLVALIPITQADDVSRCAALTQLALHETSITSADHVGAGAFPIPKEWEQVSVVPALKAYVRQLPPFCRVVGVIHPTADSNIGFELWLPDRWNKRYLQVGNAGFAGGIIYIGLIQGLQNDFAVVGTDGGHVGDGIGWMRGHPEKVIDFGYRAAHLTNFVAKQIIEAVYSQPAPYSYFSGCSDGGREGLMEAQRYPDDFDGWLVGAAANNWLGLMTRELRTAQIQTHVIEPLTPRQLSALSEAVIKRCDAADGVTDGVIEQPLQCSFDPSVMLCRQQPDGRCLSQAQVDFVNELYHDVHDPKTLASLAPGRQGSRGVEALQWGGLSKRITGDSDLDGFDRQILKGFWPDLVYANPSVDYRKLDPLEALKKAQATLGPLLSSLDPDLRSLRASGKKIIQYHGWADAGIPAQSSIRYYEAVQHYLDEDNKDFYRLFLAPGMMHCWGGPGPNVFGGAYTPGGTFDAEHHALAALMQWVEKGKAPDRIVATKYQDDDPTKAIIRTRPLCPYPSVARWVGKGNTDDARNFTCVSGGARGTAASAP